ncbi:MAG: TolC family protein, partial [Candidatus Eisenbacteria bacterium]|nr:TolC family protein [Candidatus Eisenbacteria bacterium]
AAAVGFSPRLGRAQPMKLDEAIDQAIHHSSRGAILEETERIAESSYRAKKINFYVPLITINGALPSYDVDQSYKFFGGSTRKQLYKTSDFRMNSFIKLEQSLLTGGSLAMSANLNRSQSRYPDTNPEVPSGSFLDENGRQGYFEFRLTQPIFKPSTLKNELLDRTENLELARIGRREEEAALRKEVAEAFLGLIEAEVQDSMQALTLDAASLKAEIDSVKWQDGVIAEEARLEAASAKLDAELARREATDKLQEQQRALALLLDRPVEGTLQLVEPEAGEALSAEQLLKMKSGWEKSLPVRRALENRSRSKRMASYTAKGKSLTGDLTASYAAGRGKVSLEDRPDEDINTNGWGVSLNLSYPIWDGGSGSAATQAARAEANRAELELVQAKQAAQAEIARLVQQVDVGYRRLGIQQSRVKLADDKLAIARERFADGRISTLQLREAEIDRLEARAGYLAELKTYLGNKITLEGSFAGQE